MVELEVEYGNDGELDLVIMRDKARERPDRVFVPKERYDKLKRDAEMYYALQEAGVDNWDGYEYAMDILDEWEDE